MYPYINGNLCDLLKDAGFKEISKSMKQQTFCSSKKASKDIEFTGYVPNWQDIRKPSLNPHSQT
jgi:hypothetical protein